MLARPPSEEFLLELPIGAALLDVSGGVLVANALAQQVLAGPAAATVGATLARMCARGSATRTHVEAVVEHGAGLATRLLLAPFSVEGGFIAFFDADHDGRSRDEARVLRGMLGEVAAASRPHDAAARMLEALAGLIPRSSLMLFQSDRSGGVLRPVARARIPDPSALAFGELRTDPPTSAAARAVVTGQAVTVPSLGLSRCSAEREFPGAPELSGLALPVRGTSGITGALVIYAPAGALTAGAVRVCQGLADALGSLVERAAVEATLEAEQEARKLLLENLPDAVVELHRDGRVALVAGRVEGVLGRPASAIALGTLADLIAFEDRPAFAALAATATAPAPVSGEVTVVHPDGRRVPCEVSIQRAPPLPEDALPLRPIDEPVAIRVIFRDISARRALEAETARSRTVALQRERLATLGQLAACVTHEINNPLAFVKANLRAGIEMLDELAEADGDRRELLREIRSAVGDSLHGIDRIAEVVQSLKGMARNGGTERVPFDPTRALRDAITLFKGAKGFGKLELVLPDALPHVLGTPGALTQVVLNLLENGLDAMDGKGRLRLSASAERERIEIRVADEGPGVPPEVAARIFEPYFTTKDPGKGTGLGLFICREIVGQMEGTLRFERADGLTEFVVELPAARD